MLVGSVMVKHFGQLAENVSYNLFQTRPGKRTNLDLRLLWSYLPRRLHFTLLSSISSGRMVRLKPKLEIDALESAFRKHYSNTSELLESLSIAKIGKGEHKHILIVKRVHQVGLPAVLGRKSQDASEEVITLIQEFTKYGPKAILLTGAQRGGDFLNNQLRGQWAERVVLSMPFDDLVLIPFGPSGAAMPGEQDHREVIMTFREILLLEGKRPDVLAFNKSTWAAFTEEEKNRCQTWPKRRLEKEDRNLVRLALCGIEVKNSTWHYEARRKAGRWGLSITVKDEELSDLTSWSKQVGRPVIFLQVLFDEVYCMSYRRMLGAIKRGHVYVAKDYTKDAQTGAGGKLYHRFHLNDRKHHCADVEFPSKSKAVVRVLEDGSVVPYIVFEPARVCKVHPKVILDEIAHDE